VKLNAENAAQANKLASETSESTTPGNDVVAQVVAIMNGITESNHEIADITTLIDGIAFQTNRSRLARRLDILASGAPRKRVGRDPFFVSRQTSSKRWCTLRKT
jgi:hypothetical protein